MNVGERIKQRRKELKMSADELSERVGVSRSTIFRYEKGDIEKVGPEVLKKIADTLNISPAELMGWEKRNSDRKEGVATNNYTETDLRKMAENAKTFDGKPLNEDDIQAIQNIIEIYLKGRL
jgi:transcriptional regulator with XRE-family HTH domain